MARSMLSSQRDLASALESTELWTAAYVQPPEGHCFHCGDAVPSNRPLVTTVLGQPRLMCCMGCQLASQSIVECGLESYYLDRTDISRTAPLPEALSAVEAFDDPAMMRRFAHQEGAQTVADLSVSGLRCAACGWLIERRLQQVDGVGQVSLNVATGRLHLSWQPEMVRLSSLLQAVESIGYEARPFRHDTHAASLERDGRVMLMRLGVAGLGAMQAMMFAAALYLGAYSGMDAEFRDYFRWVSLLVSFPVWVYAGWPFYRSAWHALRLRTLNMDVPVSIALIMTFCASAYATFARVGETYFDSVSMFIFFLLCGRYLELRARLTAAQSRANLLTIAPSVAHRVAPETDRAESVHASQLNAGDVIELRGGETCPCDGVVVAGSGQVSEALLTGESAPQVKQVGDSVWAGSQNYREVLRLVVTRPADQSQLAIYEQLMNRALAERAPLQQQADRMARWFVARVLVLAILVFVGWWWVDATQALWATVAVLVATCPCALSLATPMALTIATERLAALGLLVTRGHAIETLAQVDRVGLDKTGTLTEGAPRVIATRTLIEAPPHQSWSQVAAALEASSAHPIASALIAAVDGKLVLKATELRHETGGVSGAIGAESYRLGHAGFQGATELPALPDIGAQWLYLSRCDALTGRAVCVAVFAIADQVRPSARDMISALRAQNLTPTVLTGDPSPHTDQVGFEVGLKSSEIERALTPEQKQQQLEAWRSQGARTLMIGDGINDALVLASADVSVAMGSGADLAQIHSDAVLVHSDLAVVPEALRIAQLTHARITQNLKWAFGYNMAVLVPAALGYIPPWLAAIGMSLSSALVVGNAMRLRRG